MTSDEPGIVDQDRRAVRASLLVVNQVKPGDLGRPTPCDQWSLRDLLEHMTAQHHGFAAACRGDGADPASWQQPPHEDPVAAYAAGCEAVLAAFAEPGATGRPFTIPEISPDIQFPGAVAISFHLVDYVVHGWDVARSLGVELAVDDDVAAAALAVARRVPGGAARLAPDAQFRPSVEAGPQASALDQAVAALGRAPGWPE
ncbi:MAG TPA: TIGR03086 family metal-binding protein [Streptosporangiaceae bacterium]